MPDSSFSRVSLLEREAFLVVCMSVTHALLSLLREGISRSELPVVLLMACNRHFVVCHRLMAQEKGAWYNVPEERGPHDRAQQESWPVGWSTSRIPVTEQDVFELLGLPWREAHERNC